jgi:diaminohydroxyphosphoribosylaminopyrimidine deaminase/5-amino-6-(5-phosphoribosylamino)uracil reductase
MRNINIIQNMRQAFKLAKKGINKTGLNPLVGALIVKNGKIIGEGFHNEFGGDHAEIVAIKDAEKKKYNVKDSYLFVTLEPCCHENKKTPPCTDQIIKKGFKKVYFGSYDPNPLVNKRGIEKLKKHGIKVELVNLKNSLTEINKGFETVIQHKRPRITLKICSSLDGKIFSRIKTSRDVGDEKQQLDANNIRRLHDAILIGINTLKEDNPLLTFRGKGSRDFIQPRPIILDSYLKSPINSNIFKIDNKPIIFTENIKGSVKEKKLKNMGVEIIPLKGITPKKIINCLYKLKLQRILIEGGGQVFSSFIKQNLWDEIIFYYVKTIYGKNSISMTDYLDKVVDISSDCKSEVKRIGNSFRVKITK